MVPVSMTLNDPKPKFHGHALFNAKYLSNRARYIVLVEY